MRLPFPNSPRLLDSQAHSLEPMQNDAILPFAYNPQFLTDEQLRAVFIARTEIFDDLIRDISSSQPVSAPAHHLILGQRGMGKSTLLRRLGLELRSDELREKFIPFHFAEEQYVEIDHLSRFWLNCLDSLADTLETEGHTDLTQKLDPRIASLDRPGQKEEEKELAVREALLEEIAKVGRRPVLFIDNFHLLLERLQDETHQLRGFFSAPGAPILVAASTSEPDDLSQHGGAFYDGFKPRFLHRLTLEEMESVILGLAKAAKNEELVKAIPTQRARLAAMRDLTGGNPRTAFLLYDLFSRGASDDVVHDLERLLDGITPLYQSYLEQLNEMGQRIVGVLAREQRPMTAKAVTEKGSFVRSSVSPQLGRLEDIGVIEVIDLHGTKKAGYQIAERFFNLWYILRFSSRREKARVHGLARFLEDFYSPAEVRTAARSLLGKEFFCGRDVEMALALGEILGEDEAEGYRLRLRAQLEHIEEMDGDLQRIAELIDLDTIEPRTFEFVELKAQLRKVVPEGASVTPDEFVDLVITSPVLLPGLADKGIDRNFIAQQDASGTKFEMLLELATQEDRDLFKILPEHSRGRVLSDLRTGVLQSWPDEDTIEAWINDGLLDQRLFTFILVISSAGSAVRFSDGFEKLLVEPVIRGISDPLPWNEVVGMCQRIGWANGTEIALKVRLEDAPDDLVARSALGQHLCNSLKRYQESEVAYREAIKVDPDHPLPWTGLGILLGDYLNRQDEAERAFRTAIELRQNYSPPWHGLGRLLMIGSARYDEAEEAFRMAMKLNPEQTMPLNGLGNLQADIRGDFEGARRSYERALKINPEDACSKLNLAFLLRDHFDELGEARNLIEGCEVSELFADSAALHHSLFAAYDNNWGEASESLRTALKTVGSGLSAHTRDDWYRSAAVFLHLGFGEPFLAVLESHGDSLLPYKEAVRAHVIGDRAALRNIEPEAQTVAGMIFDEIEKRGAHLPEKTRGIAARIS